MIVRESPHRTRINNESSWPPRSPREALLSSPSRQRRLQQQMHFHDREPQSPSKPSLHSAAHRRPQSDDEAEEEEDEETIQLQLQAIEARLRLKKLQKAKAKAQENEQTGTPKEASYTFPKGRGGHYESKKNEIQVPLSPRRNPPIAPNPPESPRRVQLGIDKGLRANDVSLKKARSDLVPRRLDPRHRAAATVAKPRSFNERLAEVKGNEIGRFERLERARSNRSHGFGLSGQNACGSTHDDKGARTAEQDLNPAITSNQRQEHEMVSTTRPAEEPSDKSSPQDLEKYSNFALSRRSADDQTLNQAFDGKMLISIPKLLHDVTAPHYDPPDSDGDFVVFGIIASKSSPHNKAKTHLTSTTADEDDREHSLVSKFMVLKLTDLKWEVDLFLFETAFARFWKLTVGTVIAILNPGIMPPKVRDTGRFSLKLSSSEDTILELGMAKDIGWCKSIKKDGQECMQWIDGRKTEFCDFHVNMRISKARANRMEINGMVGIGIFGNSKTSASKYGGGKSGPRAGTWNGRDGGRRNQGSNTTDGQTYADAYVLPRAFSSKLNTARILDAEDYVQGGLSKAEQSRKRLAAKEKERELALKLGAQGGGLGGEYMRLHHKRGGPSGISTDGTMDDMELTKNPFPNADGEDALPMTRDAASLGLIRGRGGGGVAVAVDLGPVEGRKGHGAARISSEPMGWSGAFKRGLLSPTRGRSPEKKKVKLKVPTPDESEADERKTVVNTGPIKSPSFSNNETIRRGGTSLAVKSALKKTHNESYDDDDDDLDIIV